MRSVAAPTAPDTTPPTLSTAITTPSRPNAMRKGTNSAALRSAACLRVSQDWLPSSEPPGTVAAIVARSLSICAVVVAAVSR
jgi:hypothetical protein